MMGQSIFEKVVKKAFSFVGLNVSKYHGEYPEIWSNIDDFKLLFREIESHTVVSQDRCFMLYQMARYAESKEGEIAEVGVYKGGTGKLIAKTCPGKSVHLFDTFSGMPQETRSIDLHRKGDFADTSLDSVKMFLSDCGNVIFHPGFFPDTAEVVKDKKFCLVYIDVDIYQSVKDCLEFFYHRMVPGGVMLFDDYEWKDCPGVKKAIIEFLTNKPETPVITTRYQCVLIKA
jgi:O-methyltransferase